MFIQQIYTVITSMSNFFCNNVSQQRIVRTVGTIDRWYVEVQENQIATTRHFCSEKKTRPTGGDHHHGITLRRRPSHASLENSCPTCRPVHTGLLPVRKVGPQLCFGHGTSERFFQCADKLHHLRPINYLYKSCCFRAWNQFDFRCLFSWFFWQREKTNFNLSLPPCSKSSIVTFRKRSTTQPWPPTWAKPSGTPLGSLLYMPLHALLPVSTVLVFTTYALQYYPHPVSGGALVIPYPLVCYPCV